MLNNYADSGGGFNSNHGQAARPTEPQKQQNLGPSWSYNGQLEGMYYGSEPMYMGPYDGSVKHNSYPQYPSGTIHQPVPTPVVQCHEACCQHYENRYPINPAPLRYQPSGPVQPRYPDIPNSDTRQYFADRRPVQTNLPRKKVYPTENSYASISDRHYSQYMGRGQALPVDSRQQMQMMRPQYPVYPPYWGSSRSWAGARMNCPPPAYHQTVNQGPQLQPGSKMPDNSQYMDPSLQKTLSSQHQRGVSASGGKLDFSRPVADSKRSALDPTLQSCYEYGYSPGFVPFSEVNKMQSKGLPSQNGNAPCKISDKPYHPHQMQYYFPNNERNMVNYGNHITDPSFPMSFPLPTNDVITRPDLEDGQQVSEARKLSMHYDSSSGKKRQDLDLRQYLATWEDDEDESARLSEPPVSVGSNATPYIVVDYRTVESDTATKLPERFKPQPSSQDSLTKPSDSSPSSEHKRTEEQSKPEENTERTIVHSSLHSQISYAPSMPTLLSDSDKNMNFWNGVNKEGEGVIGKGGAFQPLDCSKRDSNLDPKAVPQRDALVPRDLPAHSNSSFDALVSFYGDNRRISGGYDLVEMSDRIVNKARIDHETSPEIGRPCDPRLQSGTNPSIYNKIATRYPINNNQNFKGIPTDPCYNYKYPMNSSGKYLGYENTPIIDPCYDYQKFGSEFDSTRLYGNKEPQKDPRRVYTEGEKNLENSFLEPLQKNSVSNCYLEKTNLEYPSMEPEHFISPIIVKTSDTRSELCSEKRNSMEDGSNTGCESQAPIDKSVLEISENVPSEMFHVSYSPDKEINLKDNVVTLHSGDQTKSNTITVEVPYDQQYSTLVKLSEEISRTEDVDENDSKAEEENHPDKISAEDVKNPTCFKLKRLPNSKEWAVEGTKVSVPERKEPGDSPDSALISSEICEDGDVLKTSVTVSNLNMPSLDDIRDVDENCEGVVIDSSTKIKLNEGVLCSTKTSVSDELHRSKYPSQPPQLAIVQPMKLVQCDNKLSEPNLQIELLKDNKTTPGLKSIKSFHHHTTNEIDLSNDKQITDCDDSQLDNAKDDISKHENFRSHKKIQGDFPNTFTNCLSSPNDSCSLSREGSSEVSKRQYSPFHMYADCEVNSQIPDFFKMDQRPITNEKIIENQIPTSPGVDGMFEDINSSNNQLCHNQIYQRKSCNFQDLASSYDTHNSPFQQTFSSIFVDDSNNKGRCDGSVLQMGDKKFFNNLLDDYERQQVSNTLEERVSKLRTNFMNESSNNKTCEAKRSPPIPPINLKLNESKKVWCITNKEQLLSLSDFSDNNSPGPALKSAHGEVESSHQEIRDGYEKDLTVNCRNEAEKFCFGNNKNPLSLTDDSSDKFDDCNKTGKASISNQLLSRKEEKENLTLESSIVTVTDSNQVQTMLSDAHQSVKSPIPPDCSFPSKMDVEYMQPSQTTTDVHQTTNKEENQCLTIVKYYHRHEIFKENYLSFIDSNFTSDILIFDEKGTHFPHEIKENQDNESESVAKHIIDLLLTNVVHFKESAENYRKYSSLLSHIKEKLSCGSTKENSHNIRTNVETVIKFDQSGSSSKVIQDQKGGIVKTTETFIQQEKNHNEHLSVIKPVVNEKYFCSINESKSSFRSIFSPMPDDVKENEISQQNSFIKSSNKVTDSNINDDKFENENNLNKMDFETTVENKPLNSCFDTEMGNENFAPFCGFVSENLTLSNNPKPNNIFDRGLKEFENPNNFSDKCHINYNTSHTTENTIKSISREENFSKNQSPVNDCFMDCTFITKESINKTEETVGVDKCLIQENDLSIKTNVKEYSDESDHGTSKKNKPVTDTFTEVNSTNEENCFNCSLKSKESLNILEDKEEIKETIHETENQNYSSSNQLAHKESRIVKTDSINTKVPTESNELNKSPKLLQSVAVNMNSVVDYCLEDAPVFTQDSFGLQSKENIKDDKLHQSVRVANPDSQAHEGANQTFHSDERLETSVIVRNKSCAAITSNHLDEIGSKLFDKTKENPKGECDFPSFLINHGTSTNDETPEIDFFNEKGILKVSHSEAQISKNDALLSNSNTHTFKQVELSTLRDNQEQNYTNGSCNEITEEDESMEVESCEKAQFAVISAPERKSIDMSEQCDVFANSSHNCELSYCVSETIFKTIDEESTFILEKSNSSYLYQFKRRKLLKFCRSSTEPHSSCNEVGSSSDKSNSRNFSIINFGTNVVRPCSPTIHTNAEKSLLTKISHNVHVPITSKNEIKELIDEVAPTHNADYSNSIDQMYSQVNSPLVPQDKSISSELKNHLSSASNEKNILENSSDSCFNKNLAILESKNKLRLDPEISSFCVRRDALKIFEPETVLKEIFSADSFIEDYETKENYFSSIRYKYKLNNSRKLEKINLPPTAAKDSSSPLNEPDLPHKWNGMHSSQNFSDVNSNLLSSVDHDEPLMLSNFDLCLPNINTETEFENKSKSTDNMKDAESLDDCSITGDSSKLKLCEAKLTCNVSNVANGKVIITDHQNPLTASFHDHENEHKRTVQIVDDEKITELNEDFVERFSQHVTNSSNKIVNVGTNLSDEDNKGSSNPNNLNSSNEDKFLSLKEQRITDSLHVLTSEALPALSSQISNHNSHTNHIISGEKSISSMGIVTGRDVLFSSRILEDEEDKESNSELQTESRSRKSSVEEESSLDCQSMKLNSQDTLRNVNNLSSETFPLQCLVEAALALEHEDSKQILMNSSSSFSGIYSQSSQSLIKSSFGDVHPNDIEDFPEKHDLTNNICDSSISAKNVSEEKDVLSKSNQESISKFEENNYNLRASTKIVTSSSSNIIPYSKRYYGLKRQKLNKPPSEKKNKSETLLEKNRTKKRKDVFTYPRSKRRKKGIKDKPKYKRKGKDDFVDKQPEINCYQNTSKDEVIQNNTIILEKQVSSFKNSKCHVNRDPDNDDFDSDSLKPEKSDFGGPLIIAKEHSSSENNIFCVHVSSEKMDDYVHELNVGEYELMSDTNHSDFKDNLIEGNSNSPDVTLENGNSLVIIIEELGESGNKSSYYERRKEESDVILGCMEETSPLPQPSSILDYCSDNLITEVPVSETYKCPSNFENESNSGDGLFKENGKNTESRNEISNSNRSEIVRYDKYSAGCSQEFITGNCYEEINENLVNDIGNWPFVEEEVAEFDTKSVSPNRIPEDGRKIELKCSLPWNKIFNISKTKKEKSKTSNTVSGLELGPANVEVRLKAPSTEWKVISDYAENSSPVVKVSRLILQRGSETSSHSEKDSEEENENGNLSSPCSSIADNKENKTISNNSGKSLKQDESWQPVVILIRDRELDELTLSLESQLNSQKAQSGDVTCSRQDKDSLQNKNCAVDGEQNKSDSLDSNEMKLLKSNDETINVTKNMTSENVQVCVTHQNKKPDKGSTYETYSPSRSNNSLADEKIYSPSDPHYSPDHVYPLSDCSSYKDKKNDKASESEDGSTENNYYSSQSSNFDSVNGFNSEIANEEQSLLRNEQFQVSSCTFSNSNDGETSNTYFSETQTRSSFDASGYHLTEKEIREIPLPEDRKVDQVVNKNVRPDHLVKPNIITNEDIKSDAEENLKKIKRKMPKNFFVRRKSRKRSENKDNADNNLLFEGEKSVQDPRVLSKSYNSVELSSAFENHTLVQNCSHGSQSAALVEMRVHNTKRNECENYDSNDSSSTRLNEFPLAEKVQEKFRLRDGGRGLKRPCEGHSKEDTKRRRNSHRSNSYTCEECNSKFQTKEKLAQHLARQHASSRELHHCILCQRSFSSATRHRLHKQGRSHRHLELIQRHTIHAVHRLLAGNDCPRIPPLSRTEQQTLQWRPSQPGYTHTYHQLTPLQVALQEPNAETSKEALLEERKTPND